MAWNSNLTFLYDYDFDPFPGVEVKCRPVMEVAMERRPSIPDRGSSSSNSTQERKRRLTRDQLELLERSFQEEIKLEPERKMRLARELRLQPRQVAVWFQNRRVRWKAKQLERVYDALKQEFNVIYREKQMLQEEVMKLKAKLEDRAGAEQGIAIYTEAFAEEIVESTSVVTGSSNKFQQGTNYQQIAECNYGFNVDDCSPALPPPYWAVLPGYP